MSITVVLYGAGDREVQRLNVTAADGWSYEFKELPKYDAQGQEIQYYVREEGVAEGYQVEYDGMNIVNRKENPVGTLRVTKEVRGDGADYERSFSFTVALSNAEVNGVYGDMTFTDGVAKFQLKHGQTAQAEGLPAGVSYKVEEEKAENYTIFSSNQEGTITADSVTKAAFVNSYTKPDSNVPIDSTQDSNGTGGADVRTGDEGKLGLYGILTTLFAGGFILFLYLNKKSKDKKNGQKPLP